MTREAINPDSLYGSVQYGFSHATKSAGPTTIHCAAVAGIRITGSCRRRRRAGAPGAEESGKFWPQAPRRRTWCVFTYLSITLPNFQAGWRGLAEFWGGVTPAANTWIGVQALALPDFRSKSKRLPRSAKASKDHVGSAL
jgi:hypothetical protein